MWLVPYQKRSERRSGMKLGRVALTAVVVCLVGVLDDCSKPRSASLDEALSLYRQNKLEEALPMLQELAVQNSKSPENHVWLAETYRRLGNKKEAVAEARRTLELEACNSFAHTIIAEATNPVLGNWSDANSDTTWFHVMKAVECDSSDGHPWLLIWGEAIHRGDPSMSRKALRRLVESGFLTKAALSYGRWMLRGLPRNAVLLTNGDMDTYPPCAVQEVEGFRRDVAVVNLGTLNEPWYSRYVRDQFGVPLPLDDALLDKLDGYRDSEGTIVTPSDQIFRGWTELKKEGKFSRPLAVAITVEEKSYISMRDNFRFAGAFLEWSNVAVMKTPDLSAMLAGLEGATPDDFAGPWVSDRDRSPIRRLYTKNIVRNVTESAIRCSETFLDARQFSEASRWLLWADELDKRSELGPVFAERIARLQERIAK